MRVYEKTQLSAALGTRRADGGWLGASGEHLEHPL